MAGSFMKSSAVLRLNLSFTVLYKTLDERHFRPLIGMAGSFMKSSFMIVGFQPGRVLTQDDIDNTALGDFERVRSVVDHYGTLRFAVKPNEPWVAITKHYAIASLVNGQLFVVDRRNTKLVYEPTGLTSAQKMQAYGIIHLTLAAEAPIDTPFVQVPLQPPVYAPVPSPPLQAGVPTHSPLGHQIRGALILAGVVAVIAAAVWLGAHLGQVGERHTGSGLAPPVQPAPIDPALANVLAILADRGKERDGRLDGHEGRIRVLEDLITRHESPKQVAIGACSGAHVAKEANPISSHATSVRVVRDPVKPEGPPKNEIGPSPSPEKEIQADTRQRATVGWKKAAKKPPASEPFSETEWDVLTFIASRKQVDGLMRCIITLILTASAMAGALFLVIFCMQIYNAV